MKQDKITSFQYATLTFFLLVSFFMNSGYYILIKISKNDSLISIIIGGIIILLFQAFVFYLNKNNQDNIIITIKKKYPYIIQLILYLFIFIAISISTLYSLNHLISFLIYYVIKEISTFIITITLISTILYITSKGISTITKLSEIFFYFYIFLILFAFIGLVKYIDLSNLKPLFTTKINNLTNSSLTYFISAIIPIFLLQIISNKEIEENKKTKKFTYTFIILFIILTIIEFIMIISVLGIELASIYQNPDMIVYKKISFLNVLERIEVLLAFLNILNSLFISIMGCLFIKSIINNIIGRKKEHITIALIGIILILCSSIYSIPSWIYFTTSISIIILYLILFISRFGYKDNHH